MDTNTPNRVWASANHAPSNYALNGKIILCSVIVLFAAVIFILCFHSYARWLIFRQNRTRRRRRRRISAQLRSLSVATSYASQPLDRSVLEEIPAFTYSSEKDSGGTPLECTVCLSEFEDDEKGRVLPMCNHVFHVECIDTWFKSRSSCPLCRAPVQPRNPENRAQNLAAAPTCSACSSCNIGEDTETGRSSSSSSSSPSSSSTSFLSQKPSPCPAIFPPESCGRQPMELVGILVEVPRGFDDAGLGLPGKSGSKLPDQRVLSLKRIWSI